MDAYINAYFPDNIEVMMIVRLLVSAILGGIVGLERGSGDRPAGLRTHILVCAGSTLLMLVSLYGFEGFSKVPFEYPTGRDSSRVAAQVVSGIGFLGAGTILHEGITVKGLTTAASLWMISAIGLAVGAGMYLVSGVATIVTLITLVTFHTMEKRFQLTGHVDRKFIRVTAEADSNIVTDMTNYLVANGVKLKNLNISTNAAGSKVVLDIYLKMDGTKTDKAKLVEGMRKLEGILSLENIG